MENLVRSVLSWPLKKLLAFYLWLWEQDGPAAPNADLHAKIIWELRNALRRMGA